MTGPLPLPSILQTSSTVFHSAMMLVQSVVKQLWFLQMLAGSFGCHACGIHMCCSHVCHGKCHSSSYTAQKYIGRQNRKRPGFREGYRCRVTIMVLGFDSSLICQALETSGRQPCVPGSLRSRWHCQQAMQTCLCELHGCSWAWFYCF